MFGVDMAAVVGGYTASCHYAVRLKFYGYCITLSSRAKYLLTYRTCPLPPKPGFGV